MNPPYNHKLIIFLITIFPAIVSSQIIADRHTFKLPGNNFNQLTFYVSDGDTVYKKYERTLMDIENGDSIIYAEIFVENKHWFLYRYKLKNGKPQLYGWQKEFDSKGQLQIERLCSLANRRCNYVRKYAYYLNGQLMSEGDYIKNKPEGFHLYYYSTGQLRQHIEFKNKRLWNVLAYYTQDGKELDAGNFCDGEGQVNIYSMNGRLIQIKDFSKGKIHKVITIAPDE